jgi:hypothetical protein
MVAFFVFWYLTSPGRFYRGTKKLIETIDQNIAVLETAQHITEPIFQDYTKQGRVLGFFFRLGRILVGLFLYALIALGGVALLLFFWAVPILCIVSIVSGLTGPQGGTDV